MHSTCPVLVAGYYELAEEGMRLEWLRLELGVELAAEKVRVTGDLDDFYVRRVGSGSAQEQAATSEESFILAVELVAMTVALADLRGSAIGLCRE